MGQMRVVKRSCEKPMKCGFQILLKIIVNAVLNYVFYDIEQNCWRCSQYDLSNFDLSLLHTCWMRWVGGGDPECNTSRLKKKSHSTILFSFQYNWKHLTQQESIWPNIKQIKNTNEQRSNKHIYLSWPVWRCEQSNLCNKMNKHMNNRNPYIPQLASLGRWRWIRCRCLRPVDLPDHSSLSWWLKLWWWWSLFDGDDFYDDWSTTILWMWSSLLSWIERYQGNACALWLVRVSCNILSESKASLLLTRDAKSG